MINEGVIDVDDQAVFGFGEPWVASVPRPRIVGSGQIQLRHERATFVLERPLNHGPDHSIVGVGRLQPSAEQALVNQGVIAAQTGEEYEATGLTVYEGWVINHGLLEARPSAALLLAGHALVLQEPGGAVRARDDAVVRLMNGVRVEGGLLEAEGGRIELTRDEFGGAPLVDVALLEVTNLGELRIEEGMMASRRTPGLARSTMACLSCLPVACSRAVASSRPSWYATWPA